MNKLSSPLLALVATLCIATQKAEGASVTFVGSGTGPTISNVTDFSPTGVNLGTDGFWFANFNSQTATTTGAPADNVRVPPSAADIDHPAPWAVVVHDPNEANYSFKVSPGVDVTWGGQSGWNDFVLPDGSSGRSGQLVFDNSPNGSTTSSLFRVYFTASAPSSEYFSVVLDNATLAANTQTDRLRVRLFDGNTTLATADLTPIAGQNNGTADVYTFKLEGIPNNGNGFLTIALKSPGSNDYVGFAGILFDPIPEPSSAVLLGLGAIGLVLAAARRKFRAAPRTVRQKC